ncbi:MAG: SRPBCC family protein [Fuerstiella sp.]
MRIKLAITVMVPADQAWQLIGDEFHAIGNWVSAIEASEADSKPSIGTVRTCHLAGGKRATERVTQYSNDAKTLSYVATSGIPFWMLEATNHWTVQPINSECCRISIEPTIFLVWWVQPITPLLRFGVSRMINQTAEELKYGLETGKIHPRKVAMQSR